MSAGTFAVSRRIWSHPEFAPCEFSEREAFLWMVSEASWKPRTVRSGRVVVDLQRGQLCASIRFMADAWQWSKSRVDRFLKRLEKRDMLVSQSGTGQIIITLCNYDEYQWPNEESGTRAGQKAGHERDTSGTNYKKDEIHRNTEKEYSLALIAPERSKPNQFDEFWQSFPRKIGKDKAGKAYEKAMKKVRHDDLMFALSQQLPGMASREPQFVPHAATWLNQERWNDEIEQSHRNSGRGPSGSSGGMVAAFAAVAARKSAGPI